MLFKLQPFQAGHIPGNIFPQADKVENIISHSGRNLNRRIIQQILPCFHKNKRAITEHTLTSRERTVIYLKSSTAV